MSTRGLKGFKYEDKVYGIFNHFDSYPSGLGVEMVKTLQEVLKVDINSIYENIKNLIVVKPEEDDSDDLYEYSQTDNYILDLLTGKANTLLDGLEFIYDSLFCEYAYIIDFDDKTLKLYRGFQKEPQEGNIFGGNHDHAGYYPCAYIGSINFDFIKAYPSEKVLELIQDIVREFNGPDEYDEDEE